MLPSELPTFKWKKHESTVPASGDDIIKWIGILECQQPTNSTPVNIISQAHTSVYTLPIFSQSGSDMLQAYQFGMQNPLQIVDDSTKRHNDGVGALFDNFNATHHPSIPSTPNWNQDMHHDAISTGLDVLRNPPISPPPHSITSHVQHPMV